MLRGCLPPAGRLSKVATTPITTSHETAEKGSDLMMIPGMSQLTEDIKALEDYARACQSKEELRLVLVTAEEVEVINSFRRFMAQKF
jgi:hypothetical protein